MKSDYRLPRSWRWIPLALLAALTLFIIACGEDATPGGTQGPGATSTATAAATTTPTAQGQTPVQSRLRVAIARLAEQVTMPHPTSQISQKFMPEYEHLIGRQTTSTTQIPELATSWSVEPDGRTWTWNLREDVPFYKDGKAIPGYTFSAKDVILTWDLFIGPRGTINSTKTLNPTLWYSRMGDPSSWEVVNDYQIVSHLPRINLDLAFFFDDRWEMGILSKQHWDAVGGEDGYFADPVGSGPWTYVEHTPGTSFLHERVENHWRKTPEFEEYQILTVNEAATRLAMILAGETEMIALIRAQRAQVEEAGMNVYKSSTPSVHQAIGMIYYRPEAYCPDGKPVPGAQITCGPNKGYDPNDPLRNPQVRLALNHAVNRDEFNKTYYDGKGFPLVDYMFPWYEFFKDEWAPIPGPEGKTGREGGWPYAYDPDKAKQMLADAGYPNGFKTILNCLRDHRVIPEWPDMCETIVTYFQAVGVETELEFVQEFGEFRSLTRKRDRPNWMWSASPGLDPLCQAVAFSMIWELGDHYAEREEASEFYKKCGEVTTVEERNKISAEFGDHWVQKAFSIPLVYVYGETVVNPRVVQDYDVNTGNAGPIMYHEWTKPVYE